MKNCTKCRADKKLSEFHKNKNNKDGLQNICKQCRSLKKINSCPLNNWTLEKCIELVSKYQKLSDFRESQKSVYELISRKKWQNLVYSNLKYRRSFSKQECLEEALKYNSRRKFYLLSRNYFYQAKKNGWLEEICKHILPTGHKYKRLIYAYEFKDKYVYVGLTYSSKKRYEEHLENKHRERSPVYKHFLETNLFPSYIELTDYIEVNEAVKMEEETIKKYKNSGWNLLNQNKAGSVGGSLRLKK